MQDSQPTAVSRQRSAFSRQRPLSAFCPPLSARRQAFTLTELLIVIAIIAVLAGLIAAAAVNAMKAARRGQIVLEIKNISGAIENFKNDYGAYPPNGINPSSTAVASPAPGSAQALIQADFQRMFKKAFPRHKEPLGVILALCGQNTGGGRQNLENGMNAAEALYFWMGGFSSDEQFPISGPGGPSFATNGPNPGEVLENRNRRYEFDLGRLAPRNDDGGFDLSKNRYIQYQVDLNQNGNTTDPGEERQINFWGYLPSGSEQALLYFDTSRHKPYQYDPPASGAAPVPPIYAIKSVREGFSSATPTKNDLVFADRKFQILHCGIDDDWGDDGLGTKSASNSATTVADLEPYLYPTGVFIGPIADTLTNFTDGELADESEE
jgi:prepilin-type N-terminal cleavage/methylation domain-containing protein